MYTKLILFRNELKNKQVYTYKLIGITSELIFSKEIFPKNKDISIFIENVFGITYKDYIMKSRTMVVAKISRLLYNANEQSTYNKELLLFINEIIEKLKIPENEKKSNLDGWIK